MLKLSTPLRICLTCIVIVVFTTSARCEVVSFSGFAGVGPIGIPSAQTGISTINFTGGDIFVSAPISNLTNPPALDAAYLNPFSLYLDTVSGTTGTATLATPLIVSQTGVGSAEFSILNPADITNITTSDGPFTSTTLVATANLTLSSIPDLGPIGSTWSLILTFQGAYTVNDGSPGTIDVPSNGTTSGSFTFNNVAAFVIPEPATLALFGGAGLFAFYVARRKRKQAEPV